MFNFLDRVGAWLVQARHSLTPYNVLGLLLAFCLMITMYLAYQSFNTQQTLENVIQKVEKESAESNLRSKQSESALCALRRERAADVERTQKFLDDNPGDPIVLGNVRVPRANVEQDLENMQETVNALSFVDCR